MLVKKKEVKMTYGSKVWIFPDAELPPEGVNSIPGHESIIITNVSAIVAPRTVYPFVATTLVL